MVVYETRQRRVKMKTLQVLKQESTDLQLEIRKLLLDNYRFDHGIKRQLDVIGTVHTLRQNLAAVQREIRERLSA
jgi:hypothetical protein